MPTSIRTEEKQLTVASERDLAVLKEVGRDGIASFNYLKERYWPLAKAATCKERLRRLVQAGWLQVRYVDNRIQGELVFFLTATGKKLFTRPEQDRFLKIRPAEYKQQLLAQAARLVLDKTLSQEGKTITGWKHEHEIKAEWASANFKARRNYRFKQSSEVVLPDCELTVRDRAGHISFIVLEVDGAYYGKQLTAKIVGLEKSQHHKKIIWVTFSERRATHLRKLLPPTTELIVVEKEKPIPIKPSKEKVIGKKQQQLEQRQGRR